MYARFPDFLTPYLFSFEFLGFHFALTWYALSYIVGIICAWYLLVLITKKHRLWANDESPFTPQNVEDLMTYLILGIILGGRLGYVIFYNPHFYFNHPIKVLYLWEGGMSFHGGFLGVVLGALYFALKNKKPLLAMGDIIAVSTPPGLFLGRLANFINQELWGRPTNSVLGIEFTKPPASICPESWIYDICTRHPSQLYEASLEGLMLGTSLLLLVFLFNALKSPGRTMGLFFFGYGAARILVELFREADLQYVSIENPLGYIIFLPGGTGLSMGQSLSLPMVIVGLVFFLLSFRKVRTNDS